MTRRVYAGLDVVRFAAALLVTLFHLTYHDWPGDRPFAAIDWLTAAGWVGVPIFFAISGFVISMSADGKTVREFAVGRALRLYPAAWICSTVTMIVAPVSAYAYLNSLVLVPWGPWVSQVYWTLGVEVMFYALVGLSIARGWRLSSVALTLGWLSVGYYALRAANVVIGKPIDFALLDENGIVLTLLPSGIYFAFGMLLFSGKHRLATTAFALAGVGSAFRSAQGLGYAASPLLTAGIVALGLLAIAAFVKRDLPISRRVARYLGLATYPLYLIHDELGKAVMVELGVGWWSLLAALAVVFLASVLVLKSEGWARPLLEGGAHRSLRDAQA